MNNGDKPTKVNKNKVFQIRMTEDEAELLERVSESLDMTKADTLRKAIDLLVKIERNRPGSLL